MLKNWLVTAWLASPLCGEAPQLDAILAWEVAHRTGALQHSAIGRWTPQKDVLHLPIPIAKRDGIYCCSDAILPAPLAPEWIDHVSKRFESTKIALYLDPGQRRSLLVTSGPYKSRFTPERVRLLDRVCWLVRGDRVEMNKLLKQVKSLGRHRNIGYGQVWRWTFDEQEQDYSIFAPCNGKKVLMKTVPLDINLHDVVGYSQGYGGHEPPYWHPEFHQRVAVPC